MLRPLKLTPGCSRIIINLIQITAQVLNTPETATRRLLATTGTRKNTHPQRTTDSVTVIHITAAHTLIRLTSLRQTPGGLCYRRTPRTLERLRYIRIGGAAKTLVLQLCKGTQTNPGCIGKHIAYRQVIASQRQAVPIQGNRCFRIEITGKTYRIARYITRTDYDSVAVGSMFTVTAENIITG